MILKNVAECDRQLNFYPTKSWPLLLPVYSWHGHLVCGFDRTSGLAVELQAPALSQILLAIHGPLNFFELARLWHATAASGIQLDFAEMSAGSQLRWCDHLQQNLKSVARLPLSVQQWMNSKQMGPADVEILKSFENLDDWSSLFQFMMSSRASRSQATEMIEVFGELLLMGHSAASIYDPALTIESQLSRLRQIRKPNSTAALEARNGILAKMAWPKASSGRWVRRGDCLELEVVVKARNGAELSKRLDELMNMRGVSDLI